MLNSLTRNTAFKPQVRRLTAAAPNNQQPPLANFAPQLGQEASLDSAGSQRVSTITNGLMESFGMPLNRGQQQQSQEKTDLEAFRETLDPAARESFNKLDPQKQLRVMRLGKAFPGNSVKDSPLVRMMQDGRLFEKDSTGGTPLDRLTDAAKPKKRDFSTKANFVNRVLSAVDNPTTSKDAQERGDLASIQPAEFIRKAGDEYNSALRSNENSPWDRSPAA